VPIIFGEFSIDLKGGTDKKEGDLEVIQDRLDEIQA